MPFAMLSLEFLNGGAKIYGPRSVKGLTTLP